MLGGIHFKTMFFCIALRLKFKDIKMMLRGLQVEHFRMVLQNASI